MVVVVVLAVVVVVIVVVPPHGPYRAGVDLVVLVLIVLVVLLAVEKVNGAIVGLLLSASMQTRIITSSASVDVC